MKFALASDVHLEFGPLELKNTENADVLVLAGDICVAKDLGPKDDGYNEKSKKIHQFFQEACAEFPNVVYTAGNHEHYHGDFNDTYGNLRSHLGYLENLHILDKQSVKIEDVTFVGGTLWTDMNNESRTTLLTIEGLMNDFQCVKHSGKPQRESKTPIYKRNLDGSVFLDENNQYVVEDYLTSYFPAKFKPADAVIDHKEMLSFIESETKNLYEKYVVVGHHAPSKLSTHPIYAHEVLMNGGYSSNLDDFITERPQIKVWVHGHTHHDFDYVVGETRIVCNPRGYIGYEACADSWQLKYIDV